MSDAVWAALRAERDAMEAAGIAKHGKEGWRRYKDEQARELGRRFRSQAMEASASIEMREIGENSIKGLPGNETYRFGGDYSGGWMIREDMKI